MTGFKSGASGDDPFGDPADGDGGGDDESEPATAPIGGEASPDLDSSLDDDPDETSSSSGGLPWIYQRSSITDGRTTVQLHLQGETEDVERQAKSDVEALLGESVKKADLREAALLIGYQRLEATADQLREWGYDFE